MRRRIIGIAACVLLAVAACVSWMVWKRGVPRRNSLQALDRLQNSLNSSAPDAVLAVVLVPPALAQRTPPEQVEFLSKVLHDEISPAGLAALKKDGAFGPLREIFPERADQWAQQAGVKAEDCVAFRMERNGIGAEVVLVVEDHSYRLIRCNNVKQMAASDS